jgi:hypothetical protein
MGRGVFCCGCGEPKKAVTSDEDGGAFVSPEHVWGVVSGAIGTVNVSEVLASVNVTAVQEMVDVGKLAGTASGVLQKVLSFTILDVLFKVRHAEALVIIIVGSSSSSSIVGSGRSCPSVISVIMGPDPYNQGSVWPHVSSFA